MPSKSLAALFASSVLWLAAPASANLLTDGNFQSATPLDTAGEFLISNNLNEWHVLGNNYTKAASGPSGSITDLYAKHTTAGNGSDLRLVQFIDASILTGDSLELEFDYIYERSPNSQFNPQARAALIGITADRIYRMYGGTGLDGINFDNDLNVAFPDALLDILTLDFTDGWSTDNVLTTSLAGASYSYIGVVFTSGCFDGNPEDCNNLRGIDNVSLVPAPATLALMGLGLAGIGYGRRKQVKAA